MSDPRPEARLATDEAQYGRCPACDAVLAYDSEEDLCYCPAEPARHPDIPSMLAVQAMAPNDDRRRFLVGGTSLDGRSSTIEVVLHEPVGDDLPVNQIAERLARSLIAAGARRGTFHFGPAATARGALAATLAEIKAGGFSHFTSLPRD